MTNDIYLVDDQSPPVVEARVGGTDEVRSSLVSYALTSGVERLTLIDLAITGLGNSGDNRLVGNAHDNILRGLIGNDVLVGGSGNDLLDGGSGRDTAVFAGSRLDYTVSGNAAGELQVKGPDGTDELIDIEVLRFAGADYRWDADLADLVAAPDGGRGFSLFADDGFRGRVGGAGQIFGTVIWGQTYFVGDPPGSLVFDASFNRGNDEIFFAGRGEDYTIARVGSSVILKSEETTVTVPVGSNGIALGFAGSGLHYLYWDAAAQAIKLGAYVDDQVVTEIPAAISAPSADFYLGNDTPMRSSALLFLAEESPAFVYGSYSDLTVFGSAGRDYLALWGGDIVLDPSFNRGGDTVSVEALYGVSEIIATRSGSSVVLTALGLDLTIPVGTAGMTLNLGNSSFELVYDRELNNIMIGDYVVNFQTGPVAIPVFA